MQVAEGILTILGMLGVIADPTTAVVCRQQAGVDVLHSPKQD